MRLVLLLAAAFLAGCQPTTPGMHSAKSYADSLIIHGETFGTEEEPLTDEWAIYENGIYLEVVGCTFYLDGAHGIRLMASFDPASCVIKHNTFHVADSLNTYVIGIGYDGYREGPPIAAWVLYNELYCIEAETAKHDIFLGYQCVSPVVAGNEVHGGGYGIGVKGCTDGLIEGNRVYDTDRQAIVDKAGAGNVFDRNYASVSQGYCFRITDDGTVQAVTNSTWTRNVAYQKHPWRQLFAVSTPASTDELHASNNVYLIDRAESAYSIHGDFMSLEDAQANYGIEEGSRRYPIPPEDQSGVHPQETGGP